MNRRHLSFSCLLAVLPFASCATADGAWRAIVCHRTEGAIERIRTGRPDAGDPGLQAVSVDQNGDVVLLHFDGGTTRAEVLHRHGTELTGLLIADVDPAVDGAEIYVGGYLPGATGEEHGGQVLQIAIRPGDPQRVRVRPVWRGEAYVHSIELLPAQRAGAQPGLLVSTYAGEVHAMHAADGGWQDRVLHREPPNADPEANKVKDAGFLRDPGGRAPHVVLIAFKTGRLLRLDLDRPEAATVLLDEPGGLSRITPDPDGGAYVTGYAGRLLHLTPDGDGLRCSVLAQEGTDSGLRGAVMGRFPADGAVARLCVFGFHRRCRALVDRHGVLDAVTLYVDVDRGHTIEAADLVPGNGADEILLGGYSKCITMLVR